MRVTANYLEQAPSAGAIARAMPLREAVFVDHGVEGPRDQSGEGSLPARCAPLIGSGAVGAHATRDEDTTGKPRLAPGAGRELVGQGEFPIGLDAHRPGAQGGIFG